MLSENTIKDLALKNQTTEINITREYFQHLFLSYLYKTSGAENLAFKGGTALRIIYGSLRFSEDLDFTGKIKTYHLENILRNVIKKIEFEGLNINVVDSKETSGGYFAIYETKVYSINVRVEINVSMRQNFKLHTAPHLITPDVHSSYTLMSLDEKMLVKEKVEALLTRKKPRDYFDLYFILRNRIAVKEIIPYQLNILKIIPEHEDKSFTREMKLYLPKSHWTLLSNLMENLRRELKRL